MDDRDEMSKSEEGNTELIQVFCRIRPKMKITSKDVQAPHFGQYPTSGYEREKIEAAKRKLRASQQAEYVCSADEKILYLEQKSQDSSTSRNSKYEFSKVLSESTTQSVVFDQIAVPILKHAMTGINGTIFAYGQTGSGKTFTMTGGPEKYEDRGIIPRCFTYIFEKLRKEMLKSGFNLKVFMEYYEIYQNSGYDLLSRPSNRISEIPKLKLQMGSETSEDVAISGLSKHEITCEEEALNLLFEGDTNRQLSSTPMNDMSTRSHCILTLSFTVSPHNSHFLRTSKVHLVDLAGSERVGKTQISGQGFKEAQSINLSLHFLEQVIVALQQNQEFVPYRNSLLTSILRNSIGGNSKTSMIATVSMDLNHLDETLSTIKFSQRVRMITNYSKINTVVDHMALIKSLREQISSLRGEISLLKDEDGWLIPLSEDEKEQVSALLDTQREGLSQNIELKYETVDNSTIRLQNLSDPRKLLYCIQLLLHETQKRTVLPAVLPAKVDPTPSSPIQKIKEPVPPCVQHESKKEPLSSPKERIEINDQSSLLSQRKRLFEQFRQTSRRQPQIASLTAALRETFLVAKTKGKKLMVEKERMKNLTSHLLKYKAVYDLQTEKDPELSARLKQIQESLNKAKISYKAEFQALKELKRKIEHDKHLLEQSRKRLLIEFDRHLRAQSNPQQAYPQPQPQMWQYGQMPMYQYPAPQFGYQHGMNQFPQPRVNYPIWPQQQMQPYPPNYQFDPRTQH